MTGAESSPLLFVTPDALAFARTDGWIANHFAPDGTPSAEGVATRAGRPASWRTLQEPAVATRRRA